MRFESVCIRELISEISMGPFGSNIKVECFVDEGIPVLNGSNLDGFALKEASFRYVTEEKADSLGRANAHRGDVVITHRGTLGQIVFIPNESRYDRYVISQSQFRVRCNERILPEYLVYYFHTRVGQHKLLSNASQVGVPALARASTTFQSIEIEVPDKETQHRIVDLLETIRRKIELNLSINNNLEQQVSALYQSWFEDFDPTNGVCPENWSNQAFSTIADISSGKRPPVKSEVCGQETPIPIVGAASVMGFTSEANHTDKILVIGRVGTHGIVQRFNTLCWTSDNTLVITSPYYEFADQILRRIDYSSMNRGSTQPLITQGDMKKAVVLVPDEETLVRFEKLAGALMAQWAANNNENVKLASLRDTLLPRLMSGELDVSDIDL